MIKIEEMDMSSLNEILENELENAFEVKDKKSLHRYVSFLSDSFVRKEDYTDQYNGLRSDIKVIAESIKEGFKRMDERFAAVDKRFNMMFTFMLICFSIVAILVKI